jgi:hypothetical protein
MTDEMRVEEQGDEIEVRLPALTVRDLVERCDPRTAVGGDQINAERKEYAVQTADDALCITHRAILRRQRL